MITLAQLTEFLGWAALINIAYASLATLGIATMRPRMIAIHRRLFGVDDPRLDEKYFDFLALYKALTMAFFVVPWLALKVMGY